MNAWLAFALMVSALIVGIAIGALSLDLIRTLVRW